VIFTQYPRFEESVSEIWQIV